MSTRIIVGDCRDVLKTLPDASVHCCVTSPPYFGLRDYGNEAQIGLESTPDAYVAEMVAVFREVRRVLRDDGTLWLNLGDSYTGSGKGGNPVDGKQATNKGSQSVGVLYGTGKTAREAAVTNVTRRNFDLGPKQLIGIPWRVAFALQADGWWLRQDIIWCLSGGAWVYARTQKGDMPVMVKDLVRLDPATVCLWNGEKWTRVLGWGESNDDSERIELVLRSGERIGCTGGHQWPTSRGNVAARELRVGDVIHSCRLPEPDGCERPSYLTNDALWLVGLYLAEGSRSGNASARQLSLSADEQHWLPRIEAVARHFGGSCGHTVSGGSLAVRLYGSVLHAMLDAYVGGAVAIDKHLRVAAWRLPNEALSALIQGYLDGDGHDDNRNGRWRLGFCRNYSLERDLRTLAARLGATLTLNPCTATYQGGELPTFRGEWRWARSGHHNEKDRGEIVDIRASRARAFWDIAVEDEPHLFALASGVLTHNCKPNPMPESVTDRCTKAHEYVFMLSKSPRYYFDGEAVKEPARNWGVRDRSTMRGGTTDPLLKHHGLVGKTDEENPTRNRRSVWTIPTRPLKDAHFATFPPALIEPCILAGCPEGGTCLDPFGGAGTTGLVADRLHRNAILIELNPTYRELAELRIAGDAPLFAEVTS